MHQFASLKSNLVRSVAAILTLCCVYTAQADTEVQSNTTQQINRTKDSQSLEKFQLNQAVYRTEYEARSYEVEVTYEEPETYQEYEQVAKWECVPDNTPAGCTYQTTYTYEWVTKTRYITKTRMETRTEYIPYDVFDHWWSTAVEVTFPQGVDLLEGEKDLVNISLSGTEKSPKVTIDQPNPIFKFSIASQKYHGKVLVVTLASKPHITPKLADAHSLGKFGLEFGEGSVDVVIEDSMSNPRITSDYTIKIRLKGGKDVLGETKTVVRQGKLIRARIAGTFDAETDYSVDFAVARSGVVMTAPVQFALSKDLKAEAIDQAKLKSKDLIKDFTVKGVQAATVMTFKDRSPSYTTVRTQYGIRIALKNDKAWDILGEKVIERVGLPLDKAEAYVIDLKKTLGLTDESLAKLVKGAVIRVDLTARRTSKRIGEIKIDKNAELKITK